ncbi:MAG: prepilin peptidase, partial [Planctomycetota bacterium]
RSFRRQKPLRHQAEQVIRLCDGMKGLSEQAFDHEIEQARENARRGRREAEPRSHAFAVVREAVRRTIGISLYPEQVMGGWAMEDGCIAEMLTGEGKTVTACLTAAVRGWMGYGVHVVTVNDYLARRDAELNGGVYRRLGLSVGVIQHESEPPERRAAYAKDITYTTDQQLIFDHLRDKLRSPLRPRVSSLLLDEMTETSMGGRRELWTEQIVHRGLYCALIDEADSVLIDQATTPAIIGMHGGEDAAADYYRVAAELSQRLVREVDYRVDLNQHRVDLTKAGRDQLDDLAHRLPAFWSGPQRREELVVQALTAKELFQRDDHYIVKNNDVHIVDPQTGRVLEGRQWQLGLHQSIQAKEGLPITGARQTMARISYQRFFQQYRTLAGMTGTAWEVRNEIWRNYRLPVVRIPTHRPMIRRQRSDRMFLNREQKFEAVADRVQELHRNQRPVLLGTRSVEASESMSALLNVRGIPHRVLNAVQHEEEAAIVASAGKPGNVTVATNMAGRGTDIILGQGVAEKGGLVVIATERHESKRIDRQLFGRAGRQGDPGQAEVYVALDDPLIQASGLPVLVRLASTSPLLRRLGIGKLL